MKTFYGILFFMILSFLGYSQCNSKLVTIAASQNKGATYLKDFKVSLPKTPKGKPQAIAKFKIMLQGGSHYRFNIAKAKEFAGVPIIQLYEGNKLLGTSFFKGKDYKSFDFICQKTTTYQVFIMFNNGEKGCAAGILSLVPKK